MKLSRFIVRGDTRCSLMAIASQVGMMGVALAAGDSKYSKLAMSGGAMAAAVAITLPNSRTAESEAAAHESGPHEQQAGQYDIQYRKIREHEKNKTGILECCSRYYVNFYF